MKNGNLERQKKSAFFLYAFGNIKDDITSQLFFYCSQSFAEITEFMEFTSEYSYIEQRLITVINSCLIST